MFDINNKKNIELEMNGVGTNTKEWTNTMQLGYCRVYTSNKFIIDFILQVVIL